MLTVENLSIGIHHQGSWAPAVENLCFTVNKGEIVGIIGESGSGKSLTAKAIANILPENIKQLSGLIHLDDIPLHLQSKKDWKTIYGKKISFIFQNPMAALNPLIRVGRQLINAYRAHHKCDYSTAKQRALETLRRVGIHENERVFQSFPYELSGGLKQRVMIGIAIINQPELLIADEPTTALDATVRKQIMELFLKLRAEDHLSIIFISHDISAVGYLCDKIVVLYGGQSLEQGDCGTILKSPAHPYTQALLQAVPRLKGSKKLVSFNGTVPSPFEKKKGCIFAPRCLFKQDICDAIEPEKRVIADHHSCSCLFPLGQNEANKKEEVGVL